MNVACIKADGEVVPNLERRGSTLLFSHKVDLPEGVTKDIWVEAFHSWDPNRPYEQKKISVTRVVDRSLQSDARLGIAVLPFAFYTEADCGSAGDVPLLQAARNHTIAALRALKTPGRNWDDGENDRFKIDTHSVAELSPDRIGQILSRLRAHNDVISGDENDTDMIICGELTEYGRDGWRKFEIKLRAIDVSSGVCIRFPAADGNTTRVLADVYGDVEKLPWYTELLAAKVEQRIPRV